MTPAHALSQQGIVGYSIYGEYRESDPPAVYAAVLPDIAFEPAVHVSYGEPVLPIRNGLPKQKDFPAEMGGSGVLLAE